MLAQFFNGLRWQVIVIAFHYSTSKESSIPCRTRAAVDVIVNKEIKIYQRRSNLMHGRRRFHLYRVKCTRSMHSVSSRWKMYPFRPVPSFLLFVFVRLFYSFHSSTLLLLLLLPLGPLSLEFRLPPEHSRNISTHSCASCRSDLYPPAGLKDLLRLL